MNNILHEHVESNMYRKINTLTEKVHCGQVRHGPRREPESYAVEKEAVKHATRTS